MPGVGIMFSAHAQNKKLDINHLYLIKELRMDIGHGLHPDYPKKYYLAGYNCRQRPGTGESAEPDSKCFQTGILVTNNLFGSGESQDKFSIYLD